MNDVTGPSRPIWAAYSSITSTVSAANGRSMSKPRASIGGTRTTWCSSMCATPQGNMVPLSALAKFGPRAGSGIHDALQPVSFGPDYRQRRAGIQFRAGEDALKKSSKKTMPREMGFDYMGMSYQEKKASREYPPHGLRLFAGVRLPDFGRAL